MNAHHSLGEQLRSHRLAADLTLEGLAEKSGISARSLSDIERGVSQAPHRRTLEAIAAGLDLPPPQREALFRESRARRAVPAEGQRASAVAPHRVADFTGREREVAEISAMLTAARSTPPPAAVVVTGPPGIGKTTSALEALSRVRADEQQILFVDLGGFGPLPLTPLQVLRALLRQVPGIGDRVPSSLDEAVMLWLSVSTASPAAVLLDNAAHESQVRPVLTRECENKTLVTSRRSLAGLEAVRRVTLGPLSDEESVQLLAKLIPENQRAAGDLRELAQLSDHVPLAMRIAGNRIASQPALQTADFIARLRSSENRLRLLVAGDLAVEAAFALSYDDLEPRTAELFRAITVIDGPTFDARIAAATVDHDVLDVESRLDELTDLGLIEARGGNRFRMHDLVRLFAVTRRDAVDGPATSLERRARLRAWLLAALERAGAWYEPGRTPDAPGSSGTGFPDAETAAAWIRIEENHWWPAMREAAAVGEHGVVVDVADALHWFSELWMEWGHWLELFTLAAESAGALGDKRLEAMHLGYTVWAHLIETKDHVEALAAARLAVAAAEESGDHQQRGWAFFYLCWVLRTVDFEESIAAGRESMAQFQLARDDVGLAQIRVSISILLNLHGDHSLAVRELRRVLDHAKLTTDGTPTLAQMITRLSANQDLSSSYVALGRYAEAIDAASVAVEVAETFGTPTRVARALRYRATAYFVAGDVEAAKRDIDRAIDALDEGKVIEYFIAEREELEELRRTLPE